MDKLVTIKISGSDRDRGYPVTLQIAQEYRARDNRVLLDPKVEMTGQLPSASAVLQDYRDWQNSYLNLDLNPRLEAQAGQITNISIGDLRSKCQNAAHRAIDSFNRWLNAESFSQIREKLKSEIDSQDEVRLILQIDDHKLHCLPWQVGDIFTSYKFTELVFRSPNFEKIHQLNFHKNHINILAILGNSEGINVGTDRQTLTKLPNAKVEFLVEPQQNEINDLLWDRPWDILFFAGHSSSNEERSTGSIKINKNDNLSLEQLRYGLQKAIANGLKIAIFNSCDGLGLAKSLSDLQIPLVIVMREPVPDRVAQDFLTKFLTLYSQGNSFYRSVREAREKLQGLEDKFPCATWLPTVYQQGTDHPPTWEELPGEGKIRQRHLKTALLTSLVTTIAIAATRFVGILQPLELPAFDLTMQLRPPEVQDRHLLVVQVTEEDVEQQRKQKLIKARNDQSSFASSLSNQSLNKLLQLLEKYHPKIIGIDTFLDRTIPPEYSAITNSLQSGNLVSVCKVKNPDAEISPSPGSTSFGFADTIADGDGTMRRHLLSMDAQSGNCNTPYALSTMLAYQYLQTQPQPISFKIAQDYLQLGTQKFDFLTLHTGGYQQFDDRGYQILLNYRSNGSLTDAISTISLGKLFTLGDRELQQIIENKIVLIGTTDRRFKDISKTPYTPQHHEDRCRDREGSQCIPGVFLQAQMTSQLVNTALENRPLFWAAPFWLDTSIVLLCSTTGALLAWRVRRWQVLLALGGGTIAILGGGSIWLLGNFGWWLPLIPSLLGLAIAGSCVKIYALQSTKFPVINSKSIVSTPRYERV